MVDAAGGRLLTAGAGGILTIVVGLAKPLLAGYSSEALHYPRVEQIDGNIA